VRVRLVVVGAARAAIVAAAVAQTVNKLLSFYGESNVPKIIEILNKSDAIAAGDDKIDSTSAI
jgi:hypothetical protein